MLREIEKAIKQKGRSTVSDIMQETNLSRIQVMIGIEHLARMGRLKQTVFVETGCRTGTGLCSGCPLEVLCPGKQEGR